MTRVMTGTQWPIAVPNVYIFMEVLKGSENAARSSTSVETMFIKCKKKKIIMPPSNESKNKIITLEMKLERLGFTRRMRFFVYLSTFHAPRRC